MTSKRDPTVLELSELFAMPLAALIDADTHASDRFRHFVEREGFEGGHGKSLGRLRMLTFSYDKRRADGSNETVRLQVPLLALLPLPALQIQDAQVTFGVTLLGRRPEEHTVKKTSPTSAPRPPVTLARIAPATSHAGTAPSSRAHLTVTMNMRQSDLPGGILHLLNRLGNDATSSSVGPSSTPGADTLRFLTPAPVLSPTKRSAVLTVRLERGDAPVVGRRLHAFADDDAVHARVPESTDDQGRSDVIVVLEARATRIPVTVTVVAVPDQPGGQAVTATATVDVQSS